MVSKPNGLSRSRSRSSSTTAGGSTTTRRGRAQPASTSTAQARQAKPPPAKRLRRQPGSSHPSGLSLRVSGLFSDTSSLTSASEPETASSAAEGDDDDDQDDDRPRSAEDPDSDDPLSSMSPPPPHEPSSGRKRKRGPEGGAGRRKGKARELARPTAGPSSARHTASDDDDDDGEHANDECSAIGRDDSLSIDGEDDEEEEEEEEGDRTITDDRELAYDLIDPSDDHLINHAPRGQLHRVRKAELFRLWRVAGLADEELEESDTHKNELVDGLIEARDPSSTINSSPTSSAASSVLTDDEDDRPSRDASSGRRRASHTASDHASRGRAFPQMSTRSQDSASGNEAGGEETEWDNASVIGDGDGGEAEVDGVGRRGIGRRTISGPVATTPNGDKRPSRVRSKSLGGGENLFATAKTVLDRRARFAANVESPAGPNLNRRRHSTNVQPSSPTSAASPPISTRSRSRASLPAPRRRVRRGSAANRSPVKRGSKHVLFGEPGEMDVVEEEKPDLDAPGPSTHRASRSFGPASATGSSRKGKERQTPANTLGRKAKTLAREALKGGESDEDDLTSLEEDDDEDESAMAIDGTTPRKKNRRPPTRASHPVLTPLRPSPHQGHRRRSSREVSAMTSEAFKIPTPPSDGDDSSSTHETPESLAEADGGDVEDEIESPVEVDAPVAKNAIRTSKKRVSGRKSKVAPVEEDPVREAEEMESVVEEDTVGEDDATVMGDDDADLDWKNATHATLVRLRRDDLVKLCSTRSIDHAGTKPQLAQALIEWRNHASPTSSSPTPAGSEASSGSTARAGTSTNTQHATRRHPHAGDPVFATNAKVTPTLLRGDHVHQVMPDAEQAATPPPSGHAHQAAAEAELTLDLESLGLENKEIPADQIVKMEKVGSGGFKDVYVGKLRNRHKVAIAEFRGQLSEMDIKELKLLADFDHPNVVRFLGVSIPEDKRIPIMMISELCENGDLFDYIRNVPAPKPAVVFKLMLDIAKGLQYLHLRKPAVVHRDCKSSNILITSHVVAKVGDFGLARVKHSTRSMIRSLVGTVCYQPPEMWTAHPKYDSKVDVFSCAMVFWEMLQWHKAEKKYPWEGMNEHAIYDTVGTKKLRPSVHKLRHQWGADVVDLMEAMWAQEPKDRPDMTFVVDTLMVLIQAAKSK